MLQEIPFNSFRGESLTKTFPTTLGLVRNIMPVATSLRGVNEFQHTSNLTNLSLTLFLAHLADLSDTILKGDHLRTIVTKFGFN
jgi:vacuolar-type H+-ATPase subunit C/Vma6